MIIYTDMKDRIRKIEEQIASVCHKHGRDPAEIILIGVTKYSQTSLVQSAIDAGLANIAENRVLDARDKFAGLQFPHGQVTKHLIGHLQSNKAKLAVGLFDVIQSIDSFKLARAIDEHAKSAGRVIDVLVQVNCSKEEQKSGVEPAMVLELIDQIIELKNVRLKGLMTLAALTENQSEIHKSFSDLRRLRDQANEILARKSQGPLPWLSMGMSHDFEIAIAEGANMLRIGRALFGG